MDWIIDPEVWASLLTLTALEIVLGIDNLVFIAILAGRLPAEQQNRARQIGPNKAHGRGMVRAGSCGLTSAVSRRTTASEVSLLNGRLIAWLASCYPNPNLA
jgi:predicted tellurium resistance membrane protein TerC